MWTIRALSLHLLIVASYQAPQLSTDTDYLQTFLQADPASSNVLISYFSYSISFNEKFVNRFEQLIYEHK